MLIFNEKAYFFRRKKGEEQKKTRSILLNLVPCYLETVLIGQPHMITQIKRSLLLDIYKVFNIEIRSDLHGNFPILCH